MNTKKKIFPQKRVKHNVAFFGTKWVNHHLQAHFPIHGFEKYPSFTQKAHRHVLFDVKIDKYQGHRKKDVFKIKFFNYIV